MSSDNQAVSTADEVKAVSMLARGDSYKEIAMELGIVERTVGKIKTRNLEAIESIKGELQVFQTKKAKRLLDRSHQLIDQRLSAEEKVQSTRDDLKDAYDDGEITYGQYLSGLRVLPTLSLAELTSLSKEMFNQSQIEEGKPTSIPGGAGATTDDAAKKLDELIQALHSNDSVKMLELIND